MTKYKLKDQELQKMLDEISNGDFSHRLQNELQDIRGNGTTDADYRIFFGFMSGRAEIVNRFSMLLYDHEIEEVPEYNPNDWNDYPEVTPPEGVLMRIEGRFEDCIFRCSAVFKEGIWCSEDEVPEKVKELGWEIEGVKRFRPWE